MEVHEEGNRSTSQVILRVCDLNDCAIPESYPSLPSSCGLHCIALVLDFWLRVPRILILSLCKHATCVS